MVKEEVGERKEFLMLLFYGSMGKVIVEWNKYIDKI